MKLGDIVKKFIGRLVWIVILILIVLYRTEISQYIVKTFIYHNYAVESLEVNPYTQERSYHFVQKTDDFIAKDYQHLLNIFYTILDSGKESFYFFCDESYTDCKKDVDHLIPVDGTADDSVLADLNNFVHPYNSYKEITISVNNFGKVSVTLEKQYPQDKIEEIETAITNIRKETEKENMSLKEKIKAFHDYIINETTYDKERADDMNNSKYKNSTTHTAYGLLEEKKALCGGYSDIMSIYLYHLGVPNIRVSADHHVWNLVYLEDTWYHLDVTWDDPVTDSKEPMLLHDYFLISYQELMDTDNIIHRFDEEIYQEAK